MKKEKPLTVRQVIEHLKTLPQDMEVYHLWDEGGTYHPVTSTKMAAHIEAIVFRKPKYWSGKEWFSAENEKEDGSKKVCVI